MTRTRIHADNYHTAQFNDDFFLTRNLTRSDFASPLFGSVFRMQNDLQVSSTAKGISKADLEGEWPSLGYSNWLLDQRFGARSRPYLQHFVKSFPTPLMEEISSIWGQELTEVSSDQSCDFALLTTWHKFSLPRSDLEVPVMERH